MSHLLGEIFEVQWPECLPGTVAVAVPTVVARLEAPGLLAVLLPLEKIIKLMFIVEKKFKHKK